MRNTINLATSPFVNYRPFALGAGLLGVVTLAVTVFVAMESVQAWQERTAAQAHLTALKSERARLMAEQQRLESELQDPATQAVLRRTRFLNDLIRQKNLSWTQLFFDVAERLPRQVRILSVSPSLRQDGRLQVELQVGGQSPPAVIEFLRALEDAEKFDQVELHSQNYRGGRGRDAMTAQVSVAYLQE